MCHPAGGPSGRITTACRYANPLCDHAFGQRKADSLRPSRCKEVNTMDQVRENLATAACPSMTMCIKRTSIAPTPHTTATTASTTIRMLAALWRPPRLCGFALQTSHGSVFKHLQGRGTAAAVLQAPPQPDTGPHNRQCRRAGNAKRGLAALYVCAGGLTGRGGEPRSAATSGAP